MTVTPRPLDADYYSEEERRTKLIKLQQRMQSIWDRIERAEEDMKTARWHGEIERRESSIRDLRSEFARLEVSERWLLRTGARWV